MGAQWLSGRVLDLRLRGHRFERHWRHCIVSLSKNINPSLVLVRPRKTCPFITERLLMGRKESNQTKQFGSLKFGYIVRSHKFEILTYIWASTQEILSSGCANNKGAELFRQQKSMQNYPVCKFFKGKGSLTVWALYAYFSDSQNAAFELLVRCM